MSEREPTHTSNKIVRLSFFNIAISNVFEIELQTIRQIKYHHYITCDDCFGLAPLNDEFSFIKDKHEQYVGEDDDKRS